jgi:hypothetical protein
MLGSVRMPSPEHAQGLDDDDVFSAMAPAGSAPGAPRKPRPRAARHREIHRRVVRLLHIAIEGLASAGGAEDGERASGCRAAVEEAKKLAWRFSTNARALSETLHLEAVRAEARVAGELERAAARAATRAVAGAAEL